MDRYTKKPSADLSGICCPVVESVAKAAAEFGWALARVLGAPLTGTLPPRADPARSRLELEQLLNEKAAATAPAAAASATAIEGAR